MFNAFNAEFNMTCEPFPDVSKDNVFYEYITSLKCNGVISGFSDGTYKPEDPVTRGQAAKFVTNSLEAKGVAINLELESNFPDVPPEHTFYKYISFLTNTTSQGEAILKGFSDGTYKPERNLSRGQMAKVIDVARRVE